MSLSANQLAHITASPIASEWLRADSPSPFCIIEGKEGLYLCLSLSHPKKWSSLETEVAHFSSVVFQLLGSIPLPEQLIFFRP